MSTTVPAKIQQPFNGLGIIDVEYENQRAENKKKYAGN